MNRAISEEKKYYMHTEDRTVFKRIDISLICHKGILWITWPGSNDVILTETQRLRVRTDGVISITSLAESEIIITGLIHINSFKTTPERLITALISFFRKGLNETLFRDSIIPIIR